MSGALPIFAEIVLPTWSDFASFALPVLVLGASTWGIWNADRIVRFLFPDAEFERSLGWLNIRAAKRASRALRWLDYCILILLVDSLFGIYWSATGLPLLADWADPGELVDLIARLGALALCLAIWGIYFKYGLLPRLRAEREAAEHKKFLASLDAAEEKQNVRARRSHNPLLQKPCVNGSLPSPATRRRWNMPGG